MPNYKIFNDSGAPLNSLMYGQYDNGYVPAKTDNSGYLYVKPYGSANIPQNLPYTAFGELEVAQLTPKAGWTFAYNINSDIVNSSFSGTASITQSGGMAVIQTGATSGSWGYIQTIDYLRYIPGIGGMVRFTALFTTGVAGSKQVIGYGDDNDGFFFGYNGSSFGILRRQNGTEYWTAETAWNIDPMNGSGPSGVNLDPTKGNVYQISFQYLGYGAIEFSIENSTTGSFVIVHRLQYANLNTLPSIFNPSLPLSAKINNSGAATNITLQTACAMAFQEYGTISSALLIANSYTATKSITANTENAIFSIRDVSTFQSKSNRVRVKLEFISYVADGTKNVTYRLIKNTTLGGTPSWGSINANTSVVQVDTSGTTVSGGKNIVTWAGSKTEANNIFFPDSSPVYIIPGDTLTIAALSTANADIACSLTWNELF